MNKKIKILIAIASVLFVIITSIIIINFIKEPEIKDRIGYKVKCNSDKDDNESMKMWLKDYMNQFKQKGLNKELLVENYTLKSSKLLGNNIVKLNFTINSKKTNPKLEKILDGTYDSKSWLIICEWILKFEIDNKGKDKIYYTVVDEYDPSKEYKEDDEFFKIKLKEEEEDSTGMDEKTKAEYDEKYKEEDEKSRDEFNQEFLEQSKGPVLDTENTYRIYNDVCSVSYDNGSTWIDVPVSLEELCRVMDGNSYYNKLQDGCYLISPEKTIISYGGTKDTPLSIIKSIDKGKSWKKVTVDKKHEIIYSGRLKFLSFVSNKVGFIIVTTERAMSTEAKSIYKTIDGGESWSEVQVKFDINHHTLYKGVFLTEKLGFISMICNEKPEIYRTEDGGINWEIIELPETILDSGEFFIQPEIPYKDGSNLYLLISQGETINIDKKAKFISADNGKTFRYTNEIID